MVRLAICFLLLCGSLFSQNVYDREKAQEQRERIRESVRPTVERNLERLKRTEPATSASPKNPTQGGHEVLSGATKADWTVPSAPRPRRVTPQEIEQALLKSGGGSECNQERGTAEFVCWLRVGAEAGIVADQLLLAKLYHLGLPGDPELKPDDALALRWFRAAAAQGDALAYYNMGVLHSLGRGVPLSHSQAHQWYLKAIASEQADAPDITGDASFCIGQEYEHGFGLVQDIRSAITWYEKAAAKESYAAKAHLATLYAEGRGVPADAAKAQRWRESADVHQWRDHEFVPDQRRPPPYIR